MSYLTVVTPTYNRANKLNQVYQSLLKQRFKDFEWLIIDDGSTDNTKEIVQVFIVDGKLKMNYQRKENGGKHTALNYAYQFVSTDYLLILDSDDELTENALQDFYDIWEEVENKDEYWCISARCIDSQTGKMIGKPFCEGINNLKGNKKRKAIEKAVGEKCTFRKTKVLAANPFPVFETTKFISEDMIWSKIHKQFDQYCVNNIVRIYHTEGNDGLSKGNMHSSQKYYTYYYLSRYIINDDFERIRYNIGALSYLLHLSRCAIEVKIPYGQVMREIHGNRKRVLVTFGYPISLFWVYVMKKILCRGSC